MTWVAAEQDAARRSVRTAEADPRPQRRELAEARRTVVMCTELQPCFGTRQLTGALAAYRGALLVASHDLPFLRTLGITRWLRLGRALTEIDPP